MSNSKTQPALAEFGSRRIYYDNFAEHLLNAYNPNMTYPGLPYRWSDADWRTCIDMLAAFGFNVFEFWLVPRLFCREGLTGEFGREYTRQIQVVIEHAHRRGIKVEAICGLATVGSDWHTFCPNLPAEWAEIQYLWDEWTRRLPLDIIGIFPGDPGACSRHGCTALTYIDRSCDIAHLIRKNLPAAEVELNTWGPPIFGWGNIQGPPDWQGEFVQNFQGTAWTFSKTRADEAMTHLLKRLPDFPRNTSVSINLGFNPDGNPDGERDARPWAQAIAKTNRIYTWDFSLTEGENAILPHHRFERLYQQRRREREAAPYSGGICFTMTPRLNQLSLYQAAHSFLNPDDDYRTVSREFFSRVLGPAAAAIAEFYPLFEIIPDWGHYVKLDIGRAEYHQRMTELVGLLKGLEGHLNPTLPLLPTPEAYRQELLFFADIFAKLSAPAPDYDNLRARYWQHVYAIYDQLPAHVDPRPHYATDNLFKHFQEWK